MDTPLVTPPQPPVTPQAPEVSSPHTRLFALPWVVAGVVVAAAALGYTIGAIKSKPVPEESINTNVATVPQPEPETTGSEVPLVADAVAVGGKLVLTGTISHLTNQGFELEVTKPVVNTASRTVGSRTTYYNVRLMPSTKLTQYTFTSTIPPTGGEPEIQQTITKLTASKIKEGEVATVTGSNESQGLNLVALDVRITNLVKL